MKKDIIKKLLEYIDVETPTKETIAIELKNPYSQGFISILLKCDKINENEWGKDSILIKDPSNENYKFEELNNDLKERINKRNELAKFFNENNTRYIHINIKVNKDNEKNFLKEYSNLSKDDFIEFTREIIDIIINENCLPSFKETLLIWHMKELKENKNTKNPIHLHIILEEDKHKNISNIEDSFIKK